jgi:NADPH:quinone reductase-like Zn-dependent oxidoreductase
MENRVWVVEAAGGGFVQSEIPLASLKPGEVLVEIATSGVSVLDTKIRAGKAAHAKQPLPAVLGLEMAGTVVEAGPSVTAFRAGDEVYGMVGGVGGLQGTLAQFVAADARLLARKPRALSMRETAALPLNCITAWEGLVDRARISPGKTVLVHGGAGGVGHLAVQIAKAFGARVYATVSKGKAAIVQSYGATPIDYTTTSVEEYVATYTQAEGFDIIYDTQGGSTLDASFQAVKSYTGHVVSCLGWGTHSLAPLSFRAAAYSGVFTLLPLLTGKGRARHGEILSSAGELVDAGKLKPLVNESRFTTSQLAAAYLAAESGATGKAVVEIRHSRQERT